MKRQQTWHGKKYPILLRTTNSILLSLNQCTATNAGYAHERGRQTATLESRVPDSAKKTEAAPNDLPIFKRHQRSSANNLIIILFLIIKAMSCHHIIHPGFELTCNIPTVWIPDLPFYEINQHLRLRD
jgi:hypothetical protein